MRLDLRSIATRLLASTAVLAVAACGGDDDYSSGPEPDPTPVQAATVDAAPSIRFTPGEVNLVRGGTVTFRFGGVPHNVFFDDAPAGAPEDIEGTRTNESVARTFGTAGTFGYECLIHPGMRGTVIVHE